MKLSALIKTLGLWGSGVLFCVEILREVLLSLSYFIHFFTNGWTSGIRGVSINTSILGNLISEFLLLVYLIIGIVFLSQLFNKATTLNPESYKWVYSMSIFIFVGFWVRYISNSYEIEKIILFGFNLVVTFISLTFIFFFQNTYKNIAKGKYSYMMFILSVICVYIFYLTRIAPRWEYYRIIFW